MKDIVLTVSFYISDNWYGERYRVLLSKENGIGFLTKTEAKKFTSKLKKYTKTIYNYIPFTPVNVEVGERETFKSYTYCSNGPSLSYKHFNITIKDLEEKIK